MHAVMDEVEKAIQEKNSPFGAVIAALDGTIIATAHATTHSEMDPTAHGEMNAIRSACKKLGTKDLSPYCLVSNAQSCPMCFSAAVQANISHFIFGYAEDDTLVPRATVFEMKKYCKDEIQIETGVLVEQCREQIERGRTIKKNP